MRSLFRAKVLSPILGLAAYTGGICWILWIVGFWTGHLLKDTIYWFLFAGVGMAISAVANRGRPRLLGRVLWDTLRVIVVLEFLVTAYTFALWIELLLVPTLTLLVLMTVVAERSAEYESVAKALNTIQAVVGLSILGAALAKALADLETLGSLATVREFTLPFILSMCFIPAVGLLLLYSDYESLFLKLDVGFKKPPDLIRYAKRRLVLSLGLSPTRVRAFLQNHGLALARIRSREEVDELLARRNGEDDLTPR